MYFYKIVEFTMSRSDTSPFKEALVSMAKDFGLQPLFHIFPIIDHNSILSKLKAKR
jgi:transcription initiation factor TFIID subunit 6